MDVKRSAWHYKVSNRDRQEKTNDNLCNYFWRLIGNVFGFIGKVFVILFFSSFFVVSCYWIATDTILLILVLWMISTAFLPPLAIYYLRKILGKSPEMPYGNIVTAYMKARKDKVCPLINYTD